MSPVTTAARAEWSKRLARALNDADQVPNDVVERLLQQAQAEDRPLAAVLISQRVAAPALVVTALAQLARLPAIDLETERPAPDMAGVLPPLLAKDHRAVALRSAGNQLVLVFAEPPDDADVRSIGSLLGYKIVPALGDPLVIERLLNGEGPARLRVSGGGQSSDDGPAPPGSPMSGDPSRTAPPPAPIAGNGLAGDPRAQHVPPPAPAVGLDFDDPFGFGAPESAVQAPPPPPPPPAPTVTWGAGSAVLPADLQVSSSAHLRPTSPTGRPDLPLHVDDLLRYTVAIGASDLHLTANMPPTVRLHGALRPLEDVEPMDNNTLRDMIFGVLPQSLRERFEEEHELDTSHTIAGVGRFRVNVALQRGTIAVALRPIPHTIPEFSTLGIPEAVAAFANLRRGLVLVTGPTGSGKSTTLASVLDIINRNRPVHIVTVEDPIEFLHPHKRSIISQREVGSDTYSFAEALRRALRQDPDVILVGEMRDLETISTALTAAETGHLVFATLHTQDAPSTIDRVIDVFPPEQQEQIRIQLGSALAGVVTQQLVPTVDGRGRAVACEVLVCTPAIQNLIRGAKTHQIYSLMQTGSQYGMQTMDQALALLVRKNQVTQGVAQDRCHNEEDFRNHLLGK